MMRSLLATGALLAVLAPFPARGEAPPAKVLRSLVFDVSYSAHSNHEKKTSGLYGAETGSGLPSGGGTTAVGLDGSDTGRITIDIVAVTQDGGLVLDTAYAGKLTQQPATRIALFADGRMSADPSKPLAPSLVYVLPLLARGFVANRTIEPGASWTVAAPPPLKGSTAYRVTALDGQVATLALEGTSSLAGVNGFSESDRGTARYATDLLVPVSYDVNARIRRQPSIDETVTTDAHIVVTLVSDTFTKKRQ